MNMKHKRYFKVIRKLGTSLRFCCINNNSLYLTKWLAELGSAQNVINSIPFRSFL